MTTETNTQAATADGAQPEGQATQTPADSTAAALLKEITKLREKNRELSKSQAETEAAQKAAEEARLAEQSKFKELAELKAKEAEDARKQLENLSASQSRVYINAEIRAKREALIDPDDVKLFDVSGLKVEGEEVVGFADAWAEFEKKKPHLFKGKKADSSLPSPRDAYPSSAGSVPPGGDVMAMTNAQFDAYVKRGGKI